MSRNRVALVLIGQCVVGVKSCDDIASECSVFLAVILKVVLSPKPVVSLLVGVCECGIERRRLCEAFSDSQFFRRGHSGAPFVLAEIDPLLAGSLRTRDDYFACDDITVNVFVLARRQRAADALYTFRKFNMCHNSSAFGNPTP